MMNESAIDKMGLIKHYEPVLVTDAGGQMNRYTQLGQAVRLYELCKDDKSEFSAKFQFNEFMGLLYHDGQRWIDGKGMFYSLCKQLSERQLNQANEMTRAVAGENNSTLQHVQEVDAKQLERHAKAMESASAQKAVYDLFCRLVPNVNVSDLDADPYLLNTPDGTIDLRTGEIRNASPDDNIQHMTSASPSTENNGLWDDMLEKAFPGKPEHRRYLQQILGMTLVGKVGVEGLFIMYGEGGNGKSTIINAVSAVLSNQDGNSDRDRGGYSAYIPNGLLLKDSNDGGKRFATASLQGKRLVIASELDDDAVLDSGAMKKVTSTDRITAERKYIDGTYDFLPSHTVIMHTNHLPKIPARDNGTWDRIYLIPFLHRIRGDKDVEVTNYASRLIEQDGGYILSWLVEGAKQYIANGEKITIPDDILEAKEEYRRTQDWLKSFIDSECITGKGLSVPASRMYNAYASYCEETHDYKRGANGLKKALESVGIFQRKKKTGNFYEGISLRADNGGLQVINPFTNEEEEEEILEKIPEKRSTIENFASLSLSEMQAQMTKGGRGGSY